MSDVPTRRLLSEFSPVTTEEVQRVLRSMPSRLRTDVASAGVRRRVLTDHSRPGKLDVSTWIVSDRVSDGTGYTIIETTRTQGE